MTLIEAQRKLKLARKKYRKLKEEINSLRNTVKKLGANPDMTWPDYRERNKEIYRLWKKGKSYVELGSMYKLSDSRISIICRGIKGRREK